MNDGDGVRDVVAWSRHVWTEAGLPSADYLALFASIGRIDQIVTQAIEQVLKPFNLGVSRYLLLNTLLLTKAGALRMNRLGWHMMVHPTTVTVVVDQLDRDRLVVRKTHPNDRRAILVELTPAGRALALQASKALAESRFGFPALPKHTVAEMLEILTTIRVTAGDIALEAKSGRSRSESNSPSAD
jgi:DNA-binding MarR family transcriptional regulator